MSEEQDKIRADQLYTEGLKLNRSKGNSLENLTRARANFSESAELGNKEAKRALVEMMFEGSGGPKDQERALFQMWHAFRNDDLDALEELSELLGSYAELEVDSTKKSEAEKAASEAEQANENLQHVKRFIVELMRKKMLSEQEKKSS